MRNHLIVIASSILLINPAFAACTNRLDKDIQKIIDKDRAQYHIPGMEVSINCSGETTTRDFVSGTALKDGGAAIQSDYFFNPVH